MKIKNKKLIIYFAIMMFFLVFSIFIGTTKSYAITPYTLSDVEDSWDKENLDAKRINLIKKGYSLVGYTDHNYNAPYKLVEKPKTLSCSGFVSWCFKYSSTKWNIWYPRDKFLNSTRFKNIKKSDLKPGDIVIQADHMGIYAGKTKSGNLVWLHCTGHYGGQVGKTRGVILSTEPRFESGCTYRRYLKFDDTAGSSNDDADSSDEESTGMGWKFVQLYNMHTDFKANLEPEWLFESLNENEKTAKFVDLTKYLLYKANNEYDYGITKPAQIYKEYEDNEFKTVNSKLEGTVGWEFTKSWENNDLRKYMNDDGIEYDSSTYIYSSVTEDRKSYIMHDKIGEGNGDKYYGFVHFYDIRTGYGWQHITNFMDQGINIKENEYNVWTESKLDTEIADKVGISIWEEDYKTVENLAKVKNVELEDFQFDCLVDMLYEGYSASDIQSILTAYKRNGLDEDKIKAAVPKAFEGNRGEARWELFSSGIYKTPIVGEELDSTEYGKGSVSGLAEDIIKTAKSKLGRPYVWGAHGPDSFDCTGFVEWTFSQHGLAVPWYTEDYYNYTKYEIKWEDLQPGDVVMLYNGEASGGIGHAGIYIGEDEFIHCSGGGVQISSLSKRQNGGGTYGNPFKHAFRFIEE